MRRRWLTLVFVACVTVPSIVSQRIFECDLPDATPPQFRRNITIDGVALPFGLAPLNWTSSHIAVRVAAIIASHVLGVNTVVHDGITSSIEAVASVAGCITAFEASCKLQVPSTRHAVLEVWESSVSGHLKEMTAILGARMPEHIGSLGYDGMEGFFVSASTAERAFNGNGTSLEYFRSYNASWHSPARHFDRITDIDDAGLLPCSETKLHRSRFVKQYLDVTGDVDGVEDVNGYFTAKCYGGASGHWWLAPACRHDPQLCVPVLTAGDGWSVEIIMQRAAVWNMPLAVAVASWSAYTEVPRTKRVMFFWWTPDATFIELSPSVVNFAPHDASLWDVGNKVTNTKTVSLGKFMHPAVKYREPRLPTMLDRMDISNTELETMLLASKGDKSLWQVACDWVKRSTNVWTRWVPIETSCQPGYGMMDAIGNLVQNITQAKACGQCPAGTRSQETASRSRVCVECGVGEHQPLSGQLTCSPCIAGTYANTSGSSRCLACPLGTATAATGGSACAACSPGSYQLTSGTTACEACIGGTFQAAGGSTSCEVCSLGEFSEANATECEWCPPGRFSSVLGTSQCLRCAPGRAADAAGRSACDDCAIGTFANATGRSACEACGGGEALWTTMRLLQTRAGKAWVTTDAADTEEACGCDVGARFDSGGHCVRCETTGLACTGMGEVLVLPGYYAASAIDPSVYRCKSRSWCTGGAPGRGCAPGRLGLGCARCPVGQHSGSGGSCVDCNAGSKGPVAAACLGILAACILVYRHFEVVDSHLGMLVGVCGCLTVSLLQQLCIVGLVGTISTEPLRSLLDFTQIFAFDLREALLLDCVGRVSAATEFGIKVALMVALIALMVVVHFISVSVRHQGEFAKHRPTLISFMGTVGIIFYSLITVTLLEPFRCISHPNGLWTVAAYEGVVCWSPESPAHAAMLAVSVVASCASALFFASIVALVLRLPRAVRNTERDFLRSYRFLFSRFHPSAYWYGLVILLRGLLDGLVTVVPHQAAQVAMLEVVILGSFGVAARSRPWRHSFLNRLEIVFAAKVLEVVFLAAVLAPDGGAGSRVLGWICILVVLATASMLPALLCSALLRHMGTIDKRFQFLVCHSKVEAAAFARWLKMEMQIHPGVTKDVFLDTDNLESLDQLLLIVAEDVDKLVVICTESVFRRPWCLGEMATAYRNKIEIGMLAFPGFQLPAFERSGLLDTTCLRENGIQDDLVSDMLVSLSRVPEVQFRDRMGSATMQNLVGLLLRRPWPSDEIDGGENEPPIESSVVIVVDSGDLEANATAHVLRMLLARFTFRDLDGLPRVLRTVQEIPPCVENAVVVLTRECFSREAFVLNLLAVTKRGARLQPVIADSFGAPHWRDLVEEAAKGVPGINKEPEKLAQAAKGVMHENAITVNLKKATMGVLDVVGASLHNLVMQSRDTTQSSVRLARPQFTWDMLSRAALGRPVPLAFDEGSIDARPVPAEPSSGHAMHRSASKGAPGWDVLPPHHVT